MQSILEGEKMDRETLLRQDIMKAGKKLEQKFFVASNDGNISARISENEILITPTGINKGEVTADQILKVDLDGNVLQGHMKITSEYKMHLAVYKMRPDVKAIVHCHAPAATAFAATHEKINDPVLLPESVIALGNIGYAEYGTPSTNEVSDAVSKVAKDSNVILLSNHGALTFGEDVMQAYYRMENLEMVSRITILAKLIGNLKPLNAEQIKKLHDVKERMGW